MDPGPEIFDPDAAVRHYQRGARAHMRSLTAMVARYADTPKQRSEEWLMAKKRTIGGSEIATLLGLNPYSSRAKLLASKAGLNTFSGGVACWWGTMFEAVSEDLVARTFGAPVIGTNIHIRSETLPAHANSPDGYTIIAISRPRGAPAQPWSLCLDFRAAIAAGEEVVPVPSLVELKAPYSRLLKGEVPKYYVPQLLSGMALSPAAAIGLYVEVVYRLCALEQLAPGDPGYATGYHRKDPRDRAPWQAPVALGLTAVYAPAMGTRGARSAPTAMGEKGADQLAAEVLAASCGMGLGCTQGELADLGELADDSPARFDAILRHIDSGEIRTRHSHPFVCERGEDVSAEVAWFMHTAEAEPPPDHYYLLGYIPWKVFQADYHVIPKDPNYIEVIREPVESFMRDLDALLATGDAGAALQKLAAADAPTVESRLKKSGNASADRLASLAAALM